MAVDVPRWVNRSDAAKLLRVSPPAIGQWCDFSKWWQPELTRIGPDGRREYDWMGIWKARAGHTAEASPETKIKAETVRQTLIQKKFEIAAMQRKHDAEEDNILPRTEWEQFAGELPQRFEDVADSLPGLLAALVPPQYRALLETESRKLIGEAHTALRVSLARGPQ